MNSGRFLALTMMPALLGLSACNNEAEESKQTKEKPEKLEESEPLPEFESDKGATPMKERVAVIGLLNKRTGQSRDLEISPGQKIRAGKIIMSLRACDRTKPWETFPDEGAFLQVDVLQRPSGTNDAPRWERVFSGWIFKENPAANVVQHPIYDIWIKQCRMSFPGEEAPPPVEPRKPSNAPQSEPRPQGPAEPREEPRAAPRAEPRAAPREEAPPPPPEDDEEFEILEDEFEEGIPADSADT